MATRATQTGRFNTHDKIVEAALDAVVVRNLSALRTRTDDLILDIPPKPLWAAFGTLRRFQNQTHLKSLILDIQSQKQKIERLVIVTHRLRTGAPVLTRRLGVEFLTIERIDWVDIEDFPTWLDVTLEHAPSRKAPGRSPSPRQPPTRPNLTVKTHVNRVVIATEALSLLIAAKIDVLRQQRPNSEAAIAERDQWISDYEALLRKVADLEKEVHKLKKGLIKESQAKKAAGSFKRGLEDWWAKSHVKVLDRSADMGIVLSAVGILSLMGVSPSIATGVAGALVGGKSAGSALKSIFKGFHPT